MGDRSAAARARSASTSASLPIICIGGRLERFCLVIFPTFAGERTHAAALVQFLGEGGHRVSGAGTLRPGATSPRGAVHFRCGNGKDAVHCEWRHDAPLRESSTPPPPCTPCAGADAAWVFGGRALSGRG